MPLDPLLLCFAFRLLSLKTGHGSCSALSSAQPFCLLLQCREITNIFAPEPFRWTAEALLAMQEVCCTECCLLRGAICLSELLPVE